MYNRTIKLYAIVWPEWIAFIPVNIHINVTSEDISMINLLIPRLKENLNGTYQVIE